MKKTLAMLLALVMVFGLFACNNNTNPTTGSEATQGSTEGTTAPETTEATLTVEEFPEGDYIWKTAVTTLASNWNPHTYQTTDDSVPLDYTTVGLYSFIFNDELHPVEGKDPYAGYAIVPEMAESEPVDVTEQVKAEHPEFNIPESATAGFAYTIDLNKDATWDDGTPINAETYVESFKRLFDVKLLNYRASDYYGQTLSIAGAENYANSGLFVKKINSVDGETMTYAFADLVKGEDGQYATPEGYKAFFGLNTKYMWMGGDYGLSAYYGAGYIPDENCWDVLSAAADEDGYVPVTDETIAALYVFTGSDIWGNESMDDLAWYVSYDYQYPEADWSTVGLYASGEYQLTLVLDKSLAGFDLLYNVSDLTNPLVKTDLYDACLKSEVGADGTEVWSSTYNTSVETTASYGPYVMSFFQSEKAMHFVKNENWYGYTDGEHVYIDPVDGLCYPMYQTTEIDIQAVGESATRKMMFLSGQLMGYGLQTDDYATYRSSDYCYATPGSTIFFLILNGNMTAIQEREAAADFDQATQDLEMLSNTTFHMALGVTFDKDDFAASVSPARSGAYGIIGSGYIYDPDSGAQYRDSDQAKQVLCDFYGVDTSKFATLDEAVDSITGYDPALASELFKQAFQEGIDAGYITDADGDGICDQTIAIEYCMSSEVSDFYTKTLNYLNTAIAATTAGTPFEGKVNIYASAPYGNDWALKIREGQSDTVLGGWSGSLLDPFGLTDLYTNPEYQYDGAWYDATTVELTINVPVNGVDTDVTMTLRQWSEALNGTTVTVGGVEYNYGSGQVDIDVRLDILAACEGKILESYNYLPMLQDGSMALLSQQVYYVIEDYNPIMGRGGIAYTRYNYNEADWTAYVTAQGGELQY